MKAIKSDHPDLRVKRVHGKRVVKQVVKFRNRIRLKFTFRGPSQLFCEGQINQSHYLLYRSILNRNTHYN